MYCESVTLHTYQHLSRTCYFVSRCITGHYISLLVCIHASNLSYVQRDLENIIGLNKLQLNFRLLTLMSFQVFNLELVTI